MSEETSATASQNPEQGLLDRYQMVCGVTLGILAAIMAVNNIGGARWGAEEIKGANEKGTAYAWYQSKSIKASILEGHRNNLTALLGSNDVKGSYRATLEQDLARMNAELQRYEKEKREILEGSEGVGEKNWTIVHNGGLGKVKGAKQWEQTVKLYEEAGDIFDFSAIFLNMAIVMGSISLLLNRPSLRKSFFASMAGLGSVGTYYLINAFVFVGGF